MPMPMKKTNTKRMGLLVIILAAVSLWIPLTAIPSQAQQTLGGITGAVSDRSGGVLPGTEVTIVGDQTKLTRSQKTNTNGIYDFVNLPIGTYTLTFTHDGFETQKIPSITVQADRTATVNAVLPVGKVGTVVEVRSRAADECGRYYKRLHAGRSADSGCSAAHREFHRARYSFSRSKRRTARRNRRQQRSWAISPSGPMASAIPATVSCSTASMPAICSMARAPARWPRPAS